MGESPDEPPLQNADPDHLDEAVAFHGHMRLDEVFRPAAPVDRDELFVGRADERWTLLEAIRAPGSHAVIYGERGIGKTSMAATTCDYCNSNGWVAVRITCDVGDNFASIWQKFLDECQIYLAAYPDTPSDVREAMERAAEVLGPDEVSPAQVRVAVRHILTFRPVVVFLDEFDQVADSGTLSLTSNLIKILSDQIEPATLIPVGVADSVDSLISGHQSIGRNLAQVRMPRMSGEELRTIAEKGFEKLSMYADEDALRFIAGMPRGFPQYAHTLAQEGARQALMSHTRHITWEHVYRGLELGIKKVDHSLASAYDQATYTVKPSHFADVLLACALANTDEFGYFSPADVREPFSQIVGQQTGIERFNPHLIRLSEDRGQVLTRIGEERKHRYRFTDPLMEPYVLLRGLRTARISSEVVLGPSTPGVAGQQPLF
jgi:AAA ATPase domain